MKIRNSETNEEVLSINCGQVNQKQPVTSITEWSSITFDISNCDGQVVIIDKDNQDITEQLLKSKCKACVRVKEVNSGSHDDYHLWKFPVYIINQSHAAHLEALNKHSKLDVKMEDVYHQPPHEVQTQPSMLLYNYTVEPRYSSHPCMGTKKVAGLVRWPHFIGSFTHQTNGLIGTFGGFGLPRSGLY